MSLYRADYLGTQSAMVGRSEELAALEALLRQAAGGRGTTVLMGGDAGIGKTRLCRALRAAAQRMQFRVIEGRSSSAESSIPFGPFREALRYPLLHESDDPALSSPFDRLFASLQRLTGLGPTLFILEDIHWADSSSLDLLHHIARRAESLPIVLVATYRTDEIQPTQSVQRLAAALTRERIVVRIQLEPLIGWEIGELLKGLGVSADVELVDAVLARTQGNPLFIEELVAALAQAHADRWPDLEPADLRDFPAPPTLHEMVWERLGPLLDDALYEVVTVAAVIGRELSFDLLASALGWSEARLLAATERLIELRVLEDSSHRPGELLSFRHSLVQEVIYASAIGRRRRMWHRRVAAVLEKTAKPAHTLLVYHYLEGGEADKARVQMILAGDEAARLCAWKDAESMYEAALKQLEQADGQRTSEADVLERMADVAWWQNRISAVEQYLGEALAVRKALDERAAAAALLRRLANLYAYQRGELQRAHVALREALQLAPADTAVRVYVLNDLGRVLLLQGEFDAAASLFEEALAGSVPRGDCAEEALSLVMLGWLAVRAGQIRAGVARLELARALLDEQAMPPERGTEVFHTGIRALESAREHQQAALWVEAGIAYARKHGAHADAALFRAYGAAVDRRAGNWQRAVEIVAAAIEELRSSGRAELREALRIQGDLQRVRGEIDAARASYDEALALGEDDAAIGRALLLALEQRWAEAAGALESAIAQRPATDVLFGLRVRPILIEAYAAAGRKAEALAQLEALGVATEYRAAGPALAQAEAFVADPTAAALLRLRQAIDGWSALELPYEAARAELLLAERLTATDAEREQGLALATRALNTFERLGALLDVSRANRVLRQAGVRLNRTRKTSAELPEPLARLTQRELQVLVELARGRTNKQIARTLSMSPKTVGNHVSAILAKLGCATRTEASAFAHATGHFSADERSLRETKTSVLQAKPF